MIRRTVRASLWLAGLLVLAWVTFFVPLGERTLYEHLSRIAATDEAQDLGREAEQAGKKLGTQVERKWREIADGGPDGGAADGGDDPPPSL